MLLLLINLFKIITMLVKQYNWVWDINIILHTL